MGVKGLQYYIENHCPSVTRRVSIEEMAQENARKYNRVPILAVDGMAILYRLYRMDDLEWLYGGQWKQYVQNLQLFVQRFRDGGIEPVFFFDGVVEDDKKREWVDRRTQKLQDVKRVFEHIVRHGTYPDDRLSQLPACFATLIRYALTTICKCAVINSVEDADKEIARYAQNNNNCFAVLSQDTDFVIFNTKPYLSVNHLKLGPLETVEYDRGAFSAHIGLDVNHFPLLACLLGNDFLHIDTLRTLHRSLTGTAGNPPVQLVVPALVAFITQNTRGSVLALNRPTALNIARTLGLDSARFDQGVKYYATNIEPQPPKPKANIPQAIFDSFLEKHRTAQFNPQIFALLSQLSYKSSECLEDQRSTGLMPSSIIFRGLRQRLYAILFDSADVEVEEISAIHGLPILIENVKPEPFQTFGSPPPRLHQLLDYNMSSLRWKTVAAAMGLESVNFNLNGLGSSCLALTCLINFLLRNPVGDPPLALWEVDALLAQTISPLANDLQAIRNLHVPVVEARAVHLATILMRGLLTFISLVQVCAEPIFVWSVMPWHFFDGKIFHYMYLMAKAGATPRQMMLNDTNACVEFRKLRRMSVEGTYLEKELENLQG